MTRSRGWIGWTIVGLALVCLVSVANAAYLHDRPFWGLPILVGGLAGSVLGYLRRHGFWPWDLKRRKVERWRGLIEDPPTD